MGQQQTSPQGLLRIAAPINLGEGHLTRIITEYQKQQPGVSIELVLADRFVDIVEEGFDLAIRIGRLSDSSLIARKLSVMRTLLCASPDYLDREGTPTSLVELIEYNCILDTNIEVPDQWKLHQNGQDHKVKVAGRFQVNSAQSVREMLLAGEGIGMCPNYVVDADIEAGRLVPVLEQYESIEYGIYAVYPHNRHLAAKMRTFIEFLQEWLSL